VTAVPNTQSAPFAQRPGHCRIVEIDGDVPNPCRVASVTGERRHRAGHDLRRSVRCVNCNRRERPRRSPG